MEKMAKINNTRAVYQKVSELKGIRSVQADMLRNEDGTVVHGCVERKERWMRHFKNLLNVESRVDNGVHTFEGPRENRNEEAPTEEEVNSAIKQLKSHKAPGFDNINSETLKAGGSILSRWIHRVINKIWESEDIPEDWLRAIVVPLFKKGDKSICDNWRGISLLSVVGKVFTHIILRRLVAVVDPKISECQAGFRKARGCADQIFSLRRIMEQAKRLKKPLYMCFVDLKAAYDTVNREALLLILAQYGVSEKLCNIIRALYTETKAAVRVEGELTDWFDIVNGLRQGCLLSPILFNVYIDHVLKIALKGYEGNVRIEFRMPDGRRARGDLCEGVERVMELLYADDLVIICETEKLLNEVILSFERATQAWGLTISVKKTKILIANSDGESVSEPLVIRGEQLERVKEFVYLGSTLTEKGGSVTEIERRINLGYYKFNDLKKSIWNQSAISLKTKVQIYRATVLSTVLYGAESWTCTDKEYSRLNAFNTKLLRVLTRKQRDEISNDRLYKLTKMEPLEDTIRQVIKVSIYCKC